MVKKKFHLASRPPASDLISQYHPKIKTSFLCCTIFPFRYLNSKNTHEVGLSTGAFTVRNDRSLSRVVRYHPMIQYNCMPLEHLMVTHAILSGVLSFDWRQSTTGHHSLSSGSWRMWQRYVCPRTSRIISMPFRAEPTHGSALLFVILFTIYMLSVLFSIVLHHSRCIGSPWYLAEKGG